MAFIASLECIYAGAAELYDETVPGATPNYGFLSFVLAKRAARQFRWLLGPYGYSNAKLGGYQIRVTYKMYVLCEGISPYLAREEIVSS